MILYSNASIASVLKSRANPKFNNFAIALKSGSETFPLPAQFDTFLDRALNVLVIREANRDSLETGRKMVDVYHGAVDEAKKRLGVVGVKAAEAKRGKLKLVFNLDRMGTAGNGGNSADGKNGNDTVQAGWFQNEGWRSDAHKNLPGFALLYNTFPDADSFLMIDDDSYVFLDGYLNSQSDTVQAKNPPIAQGGMGILISRGAIQAMIQVVDQCVVQYDDCWAGDVRVGLCLRDAKVRLKHTPGFNGWP
ncbi:UNVERIFIED_CONTAM: hypothetical protein HDU68_007557 [Siphonaria sp. JEL0065]|nr:hypothetical protein HDU68_007557 [Siphonaria sp. JEL0065]